MAKSGIDHSINSRLSEVFLSLDQILKRSPAQGLGWALVRIIVGPRRFAFPGGIKIKRHDGKRTARPDNKTLIGRVKDTSCMACPGRNAAGAFRSNSARPSQVPFVSSFLKDRGSRSVAKQDTPGMFLESISHCSL